MEYWRRAVGVATWWYGGMECWKRATGVATWRYRALELWRRDANVATWRYGGRRAADVQRNGALEAWRPKGGALQACRYFHVVRVSFLDE